MVNSIVVLLTVLISAGSLNELSRNTPYTIADNFLYRRNAQEISFQEKSAAHGITEDGCEFSSMTWDSSDGVRVFLDIYYCKTPARTQRVLNKLAKEATKVFEKKTLAKDGKKKGERIVATSSEDFIKRPQMILWSDKDEIYVVESKSFPHALLFEKKWPNM